MTYHSTMLQKALHIPFHPIGRTNTWIILGILLTSSFFSFSLAVSNIDHLEGQAGFRMASLQWKYPLSQRTPVSFRVRYCELHPWGLHRCRYQIVDETTARTARQETSESNEVFLIEIGGLRMATNYTFQVVPQDPAYKTGGKPSQISLQTKGFSAKATKCLADSSEVVVETGPFFGGRISVEDSTSQRCFVKGKSQSPQTKYSLRIRHEECGSTINGSKVTTVILVQENVPILTHSTRRFVVVCSFSPDSFIVKAGVTLPRDTSVAKSLDFGRLIRLTPQSTNLLNTDSELISQPQQRQQPNLFSSSFQEGSHPQSLTSESHVQSQQSADSRAFAEKLERGTWETFLVFGMICVAIVASMSSVIWFIRSYRNSPGENISRRAHRNNADNDSFETSSSSSYDDSFNSSQSQRSSLDNQSELEVELDFEFSEDVNNPSQSIASHLSLHNPSARNHSYA